MATFTMRLKDVLENTGDYIGLDEYPIFDENYRPELNRKITDHFLFDEIGHETIDLFIHQMRVKMNEIMPYYNQLYRSQQLEFDPLSTIDVRTVSTGVGNSHNESTMRSDAETTRTGESSTDSANDALSRTVNSETPSVRLSGDADYASAATDTTGRSSGTSSATESGSEAVAGESSSEQVATDETSSDSHVTGYSGVAAELLMRYRESIINIDLMVINDLKPLFMQIWNNGDEYSEPRNFIPYFYGGF